MTTTARSPSAPTRRRSPAVVAMVAVVLAVLVAVGLPVDAHASTASDPVAGNAVAAHEHLAGPVVAASEAITADQGRGTTTHAAQLAIGSRVAPRAIATGQEHHVISRRIGAALADHPTLAGQYTARDPRFVTRAVDAAAHRGYQTWHRQLDAEVVDWLARNPNAATTQFERFLQGRYGQADLLERFPNGF